LSNDWINIQELLITDILKILEKRILEKNLNDYDRVESRIWEQYLVSYANMDKSNYVSYSAYLKKFNIPNPYDKNKIQEVKKESKLSKTDIINKAKNVKNKDKKGVASNGII
jgi:poly-beta-hydroxyalkanoate depolymerase